jgi:hypothetical protein
MEFGADLIGSSFCQPVEHWLKIEQVILITTIFSANLRDLACLSSNF